MDEEWPAISLNAMVQKKANQWNKICLQRYLKKEFCDCTFVVGRDEDEQQVRAFCFRKNDIR